MNIAVNEGDSVSAGQTVLTLESMKMEIPVEAEFSGKVEKVDVEVGSFVNEGDTLVTLGE